MTVTHTIFENLLYILLPLLKHLVVRDRCFIVFSFIGHGLHGCDSVCVCVCVETNCHASNFIRRCHMHIAAPATRTGFNTAEEHLTVARNLSLIVRLGAGGRRITNIRTCGELDCLGTQSPVTGDQHLSRKWCLPAAHEHCHYHLKAECTSACMPCIIRD